MAAPVYRLAIATAREAYFQLADKKEHKAWFEDLFDALEQAGGETVVSCISLNPTAYRFWVTKFPDMESCQKAQLIGKVKRVTRYFDIVDYVGMVQDDWVAMANALGVGRKE